MGRRHGWLWERLTSFAHPLHAAKQSARGKRWRPEVLRYHAELEYEILALQESLNAKTYQPGEYRTFEIREPKPRLISAAPYRERVVHHALTAMLEPIWEQSFLADSFACRKGKGTHAAMRRCQELARRHRWVYKADVKTRDALVFAEVESENRTGRERVLYSKFQGQWSEERW